MNKHNFLPWYYNKCFCFVFVKDVSHFWCVHKQPVCVWRVLWGFCCSLRVWGWRWRREDSLEQSHGSSCPFQPVLWHMYKNTKSDQWKAWGSEIIMQFQYGLLKTMCCKASKCFKVYFQVNYVWTHTFKEKTAGKSNVLKSYFAFQCTWVSVWIIEIGLLSYNADSWLSLTRQKSITTKHSFDPTYK